jgi:hypothetical protein
VRRRETVIAATLFLSRKARTLIPCAAVLLLCSGCGGGERREAPSAPKPSQDTGSVESLSARATPAETTVTPVADRVDCELIRGTAYHSEDERRWFLANCLTPTPTVSAPTPTPAQQPSPISPTATTAQAPPSTAPPAPAPPMPPPRNCSEWPGEVAAVLQRLPTPQGLCLVTDGSLSCPSGAAACYYPAVRIAVLVFDGSRTAELHAITHEVCHAHQHYVVLQAGLPQWPLEPSWRQTPQGAAFPDPGSEPWPTGWVPPSLLEDMAETCVAWYGTGFYERGILDRMPKHRRWAQEWLPR